MFARRRLARTVLRVVLCAGSPYVQVLPERPAVLQYADWFPRWFPEHGGP